MPVVVLDTQIVNGKAVHTDPLSKKKFTAPTRKSKGSKPARPPIKEKDNNEPTDNRPIIVRLFSKKQKAPVHFKPFTLIPPVASTAAAPKAASKQHRSGASAAALKRLINGPLKRPKAPTPKRAPTPRPAVSVPSPVTPQLPPRLQKEYEDYLKVTDTYTALQIVSCMQFYGL